MKRFVIVGQGLAGTCLAWALKEKGADFLLIDREVAAGSSRVAAGLVNPVTGKGINPSWRVGEYLNLAVDFYRLLEKQRQMFLLA